MFSPTVCIRQVPSDQAPIDLLLLADPEIRRVMDYVHGGVVFIAEEGEMLVGAAVLEISGSSAELKNIAVREHFQQRGFGRALLAHLLDYARSCGVPRMVVGTGNSSLRQLAFYQKAGFRIVDVLHGFFEHDDPPIIENGIRCLDMILLEKNLEAGNDGITGNARSTP